jgi:hypothetical protein
VECLAEETDPRRCARGGEITAKTTHASAGGAICSRRLSGRNWRVGNFFPFFLLRERRIDQWGEEAERDVVWGQERKGIPGFAPGRLIRPGNRANAAAKARARGPSGASPQYLYSDRSPRPGAGEVGHGQSVR